MKDETPPPPFDSIPYERPNQKWLCGWSADGNPCRVGPDSRGRCRATFECSPLLKKKPGEEKGRHECTRMKLIRDDKGVIRLKSDPCEHGPLPDGTCGRQIPRCQPVRSLRGKRAVLTASVILASVAGLLMAFYSPARSHFISPGEVSSTHTAVALAGRYTNEAWAAVGNNCAACHYQGRRGPVGWVAAGIEADPGMIELGKLFSASHGKVTSIDEKCLGCHQQHDFHEPTAVHDYSCSACHKEHMGSGRMKDPDTAHCVACHGSTTAMQAAAAKGRNLPAQAFLPALDHGFDHSALPRFSNGVANVSLPRADGLNHLYVPRPTNGFTTVFRSFADGHPPFQIHRPAEGGTNRVVDPTRLQFNHARHIGPDAKPRFNGKPLDCAFCHKPDETGTYKQPVTFERSCRACHDLQFDPEVPDLKIPHGDPAWVDAFVGSLLTQYRMHAIETMRMKDQDAVKFANDRLASFKDRFHVADEREAIKTRILFSTEAIQVTDAGDRTKPTYTGCKYCHEVKPMGGVPAEITKPKIPDRWLAHGKFNHAKHLHVDCLECHKAQTSTATADILLPTKESCAECHSPHVATNPKSGVVSDCITCHMFHAPAEEIKAFERFKAAMPASAKAK